MNILKYAVAGLLVVSSTSVLANEVVVGTHVSGNVTTISFDVIPEKGVAGFEFTIDHPALVEGAVGLKGCVAELPAGLTGVCNAAEGKFGVVVFSPSLKAFDGKPVPVGSITLRNTSLEKSGIKVSKVVFANAEGKALESAHRVVDLDSSSERAAPRKLTK